MTHTTFADPHKILDQDQSLTRHHLAKIGIRHSQLDSLPLWKGMRILDIGCGPGLYLPHWLEITRSADAQFTLLDHSAAALNTCAQLALKAYHRPLFAQSSLSPSKMMLNIKHHSG